MTSAKHSARPAHPKYIDMVKEAIATEGDARSGLSRQRIKAYIADKYNINDKHCAKFVAKTIQHGKEEGQLVLPKGILGSVKLNAASRKQTLAGLHEQGDDTAPSTTEDEAPKAKAAAPAKKAKSSTTKKVAAAKKPAPPKPKAAKPAPKTAAKKAGASTKEAAPAISEDEGSSLDESDESEPAPKAKPAVKGKVAGSPKPAPTKAKGGAAAKAKAAPKAAPKKKTKA